jgi:hypothetical protein
MYYRIRNAYETSLQENFIGSTEPPKPNDPELRYIQSSLYSPSFFNGYFMDGYTQAPTWVLDDQTENPSIRITNGGGGVVNKTSDVSFLVLNMSVTKTIQYSYSFQNGHANKTGTQSIGPQIAHYWRCSRGTFIPHGINHFELVGLIDFGNVPGLTNLPWLVHNRMKGDIVFEYPFDMSSSTANGWVADHLGHYSYQKGIDTRSLVDNPSHDDT